MPTTDELLDVYIAILIDKHSHLPAMGAVSDAIFDGLIREAETEHESAMGPWPEGTGALVADWLRTQKEDQQ